MEGQQALKLVAANHRRLSNEVWFIQKCSPLRTHGPVPRRGNAALLEFLPTAARAWIVSLDPLKWVFGALAAAMIGRSLSSPPLLVYPVLLGEAVPSGQLFYRITE